ncbi:MAG: SMP-30/gluconolactonase/LRE family protein, partial [Rickettsiales bacterium]|nr:SMP-30/gluconolactonase/LRE family protein [Rickettsiales bacterium]
GSELLRWDGESFSPVARFALPPGARMNDGIVAADGALWFGVMDRGCSEPAGRLYRYDGTTLSRHGRRCPVVNGPAFSPDGRLLYQADTQAGIVWRFAVEGGVPVGEGEVFARIAPRHGWPDGLTVDSEGAVWVGLWGGWAARRYAPSGRLLTRVRFPCANVTKIAFGGQDLRTVYATTAAIGLSDGERRAQPLAGALFRFRAEVPGLPAYRVGL